FLWDFVNPFVVNFHFFPASNLASSRSRSSPAMVVRMTTMLPSREISTRATVRPAAITALTARVTSDCLNNLLIFTTRTNIPTSHQNGGRKNSGPSMLQNKDTSIPVPDFQREPDRETAKYDICRPPSTPCSHVA